MAEVRKARENPGNFWFSLPFDLLYSSVQTIKLVQKQTQINECRQSAWISRFGKGGLIRDGIRQHRGVAPAHALGIAYVPPQM